MSRMQIDSWKKRLFHDSRKNAVARDISWDLSLDQFKQLLIQSGMKCAVSGIPLDITPRTSGQLRRPFFPSLDRIENHLGYSVGNCRIVCVAANLAMNQWGEEVLKRLAIGYFMHQDLGRQIQHGLVNGIMPDNVRVYRGKKGLTYMARVRDKMGKDLSLGTFNTPEEAATAQRNWKAKNAPTRPELGLSNSEPQNISISA